MTRLFYTTSGGNRLDDHAAVPRILWGYFGGTLLPNADVWDRRVKYKDRDGDFSVNEYARSP